jgi:hypothetical protein
LFAHAVWFMRLCISKNKNSLLKHAAITITVNVLIFWNEFRYYSKIYCVLGNNLKRISFYSYNEILDFKTYTFIHVRCNIWITRRLSLTFLQHNSQFWNKRPMSHIAHLGHIDLFPYVTTYKSNFPYCCPTILLGTMKLYESHFCIWKGNFY